MTQERFAHLCIVFIIFKNNVQEVANFPLQYPELAGDVKLPVFFGHEKIFSSILRISSADTQLWTHYDVRERERGGGGGRGLGRGNLIFKNITHGFKVYRFFPKVYRSNIYLIR